MCEKMVSEKMVPDVMIVDDDADFRAMLIEFVMRQTGRMPRVAANGRVALEMIRQKVPHIVLSDTNMPVMNGVDLLKAVRSEHCDLVFVQLFSGLIGSDIQSSDVKRLGASHVISKDLLSMKFFAQLLTEAEEIRTTRESMALASGVDNEGQRVKKNSVDGARLN